MEVLTLLTVGGSVSLGAWFFIARRTGMDETGENTHANAFLLALAWLFVPLLILTVYSYVKHPMLGPKRYVYMLAPGFYILLVFGFQMLRKAVFRRVATAVVLVLFCATLLQYYLTPTREDWRGAVRHLDVHLEQDEVLFGDLSTQVMYRYYGTDESTLIMDIRYMYEMGVGRGWILMRRHDYNRLSPYLGDMEHYYEVTEEGPFHGLQLIHFQVG
jgi:hypothetical protein